MEQLILKKEIHRQDIYVFFALLLFNLSCVYIFAGPARLVHMLLFLIFWTPTLMIIELSPILKMKKKDSIFSRNVAGSANIIFFFLVLNTLTPLLGKYIAVFIMKIFVNVTAYGLRILWLTIRDFKIQKDEFVSYFKSERRSLFLKTALISILGLATAGLYHDYIDEPGFHWCEINANFIFTFHAHYIAPYF